MKTYRITRITSYIFILISFLTYSATYSQSGSYHSYAEFEKKLEQLADEYPKLIDLQSEGKTLGSRAILAVTLTSGKPDTKPAILIVAGVNGTDLAGGEVALRFIESVARDYGKVDSITSMLDETTFYIFPRVNPDASEAYFSRPLYTQTLNNRPLDLDQDGQIDEDGYDDLNDDDMITWMRITHPDGEWIEDEKYPGLLKKADGTKGETGIYRLIREGFDNDKDGELNEDEPGGVNFNQNFTHKYNFFERGAGLHQISEMESRAVTDFAFAHENIAAVFSFSPNDNLNHPWESAKGAAPKQENRRRRRKPVTNVDVGDAPYYSFVSDKFKTITGFDDLPRSKDGQGAFNEWAYFHFGRWSFSTPTWWPPSITPGTVDSSVTDTTSKEKKIKSSGMNGEQKKSSEQKLWDWLQQTRQPEYFISWSEYKHPDFPDHRVEIGGFKPFIDENPPADSLAVIAQKYQDFFAKLSSWMPRITVENLKSEHLHDNVYRISLNVSNHGYLPTTTKIGVDNKWCPKIKLAVQLADDQKLAGGRVLQFVDHLAGSGGSKEISWVILGKPAETVKISIGSPMTGTIVKSVKLR